MNNFLSQRGPLIFIIFNLFASPSISQSPNFFSTVTDSSRAKKLICGRTNSKNNIYLLGLSFHNGNDGINLMIANRFGEFVLSKSYSSSNFEIQPRDFIISNDNGIAIVGTISINSDTEAFFCKLDSLGNIQWLKTFFGPRRQWFNKVRQLSNGDYYLGGGTTQFGSLAQDDMLIVKTDMNGDTLWSKVYGSEIKTEQLFWLENTSDNGVIISGMGALNEDHSLVLKLDQNGNLEWSKGFVDTIQFVTNSYRATCIKEQVGQGYIFSSIHFSTSFKRYESSISKIDYFGNSVWNQVYDFGINNYFESIDLASNGDLFIEDDLTPSVSTKQGVKFLSLDNSGNLMWSYSDSAFYTTSLDQKVIPLQSNGKTIVSYLGEIFENKIYLQKIDQNGEVCNTSHFNTPITVLPIQFNSVSTYNTLRQGVLNTGTYGMFDSTHLLTTSTICIDSSVLDLHSQDPTEELLFFPNPTSRILNFYGVPQRGGRFSIINLQGVTIQSGSINNNVIELEELPFGLYWIQIETDNYIKTSPLLIKAK